MRRAGEEVRAGQVARDIGSLGKYRWANMVKAEQDIAMSTLGAQGLGWTGPGFEPSWLSLLPALVTIGLAFLMRQVVPALFLGIVTGSVVLYASTSNLDDLNFVSRFLIPSIGTTGYAKILLIYLWCLGGLIGVWDRMGATRHFAEWAGRRIEVS